MSDFSSLVAEYTYAQCNKLSIDKLVEYKKHAVEYLNNTNNNIKQYVEMFNTVISDVTSLIAKDFPNKIEIKTCNDLITTMVAEQPLRIFSLFLTDVYANDEYRNNILQGNDKFFENSTYDNVVKGDSDKIHIMDQIKKYWNEFTPDKKIYIKNACKMMINITEQYVISKDEGNDVKDMIMWYDTNM